MQNVYKVRPSSLIGFELRIFVVLLLLNFLSIATDYYFIHGGGHRSYFIDTYLIKLFYFDAEDNIPSYFSTANFFLCSVLCYVIYQADQSRFKKRWFYLSLIFIFLGLDELITIHEFLNVPIRAFMYKVLDMHQFGVLYYAWIMPYAALFVAAVIYFYKFVFSLPQKILLNFILSAVIFISGAMVLEMVGGYLTEHYGLTSMVYKMEATIEESLEMIGIIFFARTLIQYLGMLPSRVDIIFNFNKGISESANAAKELKTPFATETRTT